MQLYKGSQLNFENQFETQPVYSDDEDKFPEPRPKEVIFATDSEIKAKLFAALRGVCSFGTEQSEDKRLKVIIEPPIDMEKMTEKVHLYTFEKTDDWKFLEKSKEWYSTKPTPFISKKEYTRQELYEELRQDPNLEFHEEYKEEIKEEVSEFSQQKNF